MLMPFGHKGHSSMNAYAALREKADPAVSAFIDAGKAAKGTSKDLFAAGDDDDDRSVFEVVVVVVSVLPSPSLLLASLLVVLLDCIGSI